MTLNTPYVTGGSWDGMIGRSLALSFHQIIMLQEQLPP